MALQTGKFKVVIYATGQVVRQTDCLQSAIDHSLTLGHTNKVWGKFYNAVCHVVETDGQNVYSPMFPYPYHYGSG